MALIDATPPEHRGRSATKSVGWLSCWDMSVSPKGPITHHDNTGKHQGAFALLNFYAVSVLFFPSSERVSRTKCNKQQTKLVY